MGWCWVARGLTRNAGGEYLKAIIENLESLKKYNICWQEMNTREHVAGGVCWLCLWFGGDAGAGGADVWLVVACGGCWWWCW